VLEVYMITRTDDAAAQAFLDVTVNNDTGSKYDVQRIEGSVSTASASEPTTTTAWAIRTHASGGMTGYPSSTVIHIPNYASTTFRKVGSALNDTPDRTGNGSVANALSLGFQDTAAISRLKVAAQSTAKLKVGSQLLIYKRKTELVAGQGATGATGAAGAAGSDAGLTSYLFLR
jgi:hypothetical protein